MSAPTSANPHIKEPHTETSRRRWGSAVTGAATAGTPAASVMRTPGRWDRAPARSRERRGDRRRAPVEPVHGGLQAVARHGDHRRRRVRHGVLGRRPFLGRESREHVLRRVDAAWRPADANTHAWKRAGAQVIDDGTDPIVPAGAVPGAEPEGPERKVEVVIDDDQVGRTPAAPAEEIPHRDAALVHIGLRDGQPRGRLTQPRTPRTGPSVVAQPHPEFGREPLHHGAAEVVPRAAVPGAGISKAHDEDHGTNAEGADAPPCTWYGIDTDTGLRPGLLLLLAPVGLRRLGFRRGDGLAFRGRRPAHQLRLRLPLAGRRSRR